jgi:hypothetical protein
VKLFVLQSLHHARHKQIPGGGEGALRVANKVWAWRTKLRPARERELFSGTVEFERLSFRFSAPLQILAQARARGIEARISRFIMSECGEGAVAVDVGANCGFLSLVMGLSAGPGGRVISFERDPFFYGALTENLRTNHLEGSCTAIHCAAGTGEGATQSVDSVVERPGLTRLDFLKVDTEGFDERVLRGFPWWRSRDSTPRWSSR